MSIPPNCRRQRPGGPANVSNSLPPRGKSRAGRSGGAAHSVSADGGSAIELARIASTVRSRHGEAVGRTRGAPGHARGSNGRRMRRPGPLRKHLPLQGLDRRAPESLLIPRRVGQPSRPATGSHVRAGGSAPVRSGPRVPIISGATRARGGLQVLVYRLGLQAWSTGFLDRECSGRVKDDAQQPRGRRLPAGHPRGGRHVGRRQFLGHRRAAQGRGLRRRRRDLAALRPRRRDPSQGRLLRRPGHLRRARGGGAHRHSPLRARLREPVQGNGDRPLRRELRRGRDAGAVRRVQPVDQVPRSARDRARARRPGPGHRPLRRLAPAAGREAARSTARARRSATRATSCSPPRASSSSCCASRSATRPRRRRASWRAGSASRSPTSTTARTSASCRPAATPR